MRTFLCLPAGYKEVLVDLPSCISLLKEKRTKVEKEAGKPKSDSDHILSGNRHLKLALYPSPDFMDLKPLQSKL
ncbi:hypothetical protein SLEP1_g10281 [Rubroshorea leprosula]|uniref:Uncharacterized protein n=1 Tax=Rubroshorea leprosula TaxID=152421 RepID=A0AAV5IHI4_9ROSI|nr:hypothetical protein SLEP1_g10281 [Rubroshorea leprosula]